MAKTRKPQPRSRGQIIQKGPNRFLLRVALGKGVNGKRLFDSEMFEGTATEAQARLGVMQAAKDTNTFVKPNDYTVATFWPLFLAEKRGISDSTREGYATRAKQDIIPFLGEYKLADVEPTMVSRWVTWMQEKEHSARTIRYSYTCAFAMFELALTWNLLPRNPIRAELPKKDHEDMQALTAIEVTALLDNARDTEDPMYALWSLLLHGGCRPQEALALSWADLQGRKVTISKALVKVRNKDTKKLEYKVGPTKTKRGRRTITIPQECSNALKWHQQRTGGIGTALVWQTAGGTVLDLSNVRKYWLRACKRAGVSEVRLYDARHTHATLMLQSGQNLKVVSERLGHASIQVTADVYAHVLPEMDEGASDAFADLLQAARKQA